MKDLTREILNEINIEPEFRGEEACLSKSELSDFVEVCEKKNVAIIGIEAVRIFGKFTKPDPNLIADFSEGKSKTWSGYKSECSKGARLLIEKLPEDGSLRALVTIYTEEEWSRSVGGE